MAVFKGKDVKEARNKFGVLMRVYPVGPENDLLDWNTFRTQSADEEKWSMIKHKHPDFEEYWFCIKGKGQVILGDETYDVEEGDLIITPRGVCHKAIGDATYVVLTAKHNVYGYTIGTRVSFEACDTPYRDDPSQLPKVGQHLEFDLQEVF